MAIKSLLKIGTHFAASLMTTLILCLLPSNSSAQTGSPPSSLNLTIELQSAYNPGFKMCTPIVVDEPLELSWTRGLVRSGISVLASRPKSGAYPVKFELKEGMLDYVREVNREVKLEIGKPYKSITQKSGGFEISYKQTLLLSEGDCK